MVVISALRKVGNKLDKTWVKSGFGRAGVNLISTFCLFFAKTPTLTIFMAISCQAIMANFSKIPIMAVLVWVDMALNMVNMDVSTKNWQNVDSL